MRGFEDGRKIETTRVKWFGSRNKKMNAARARASERAQRSDAYRIRVTQQIRGRKEKKDVGRRSDLHRHGWCSHVTTFMNNFQATEVMSAIGPIRRSSDAVTEVVRAIDSTISP